tara:strand:+ start:232 stop:819 length:588 start_codon:yes stop_codon:yes gene_type:complete
MSVVQNNTISTNSITEATSANGVSIDGLKVKDYSLMYGSNIGLTIDSSGRTTQPNQPAFLAQPTSAQLDLVKDGYRDIDLGTERIDRGSNFASSVFTAPITGVYQLNMSVGLQNNVDKNADFYQIELSTSNRDYALIIDPNFEASIGTPTYWHLSLSVLADMDANDTAKIRFYQGGGSTQTDIGTNTYFSGFLVA